jgi:hypothetical protein
MFSEGRGKWGLVPAEGFEPPTYGLQNRCTTTVLSRRGPRRIIAGLWQLGRLGFCGPPHRTHK